MAEVRLDWNGAAVRLRGSGVLYWEAEGLLVVSDLHLGKSERVARRGGPILPPYDTGETLRRLADEIDALGPCAVICLGDSFDDLAALDALPESAVAEIARLQAGRDWVWIEGNHDAGPVTLGGTYRAEITRGPLTFRHIAARGARAGEVSGHYHPKARIDTRAGRVSRACFAMDRRRLILPAFGAYTGGLWTDDPAISALFGEDATVVLTGATPVRLPMPRGRRRDASGG